MAYTFKPYTESQAVKTARKNLNEYNTYTEGKTVEDARTALNNHTTNNKVAEWNGGTYGQAVKDAYDAYNKREKFSYDLNGDALYQQYKDKYITQGRLAMADTIGQASAMTGGYGSSYAVTAGNQAYQSSLQNLNDIVPQLYQMAYDRYTQEGNDLKDKYSMLNNMYQTEYGEHRDKVGDYNTELARLTEAYNNERTFDRGVYDADRTYANTVYDNERNYDYTVHNTNEQNAFNAEQQRITENYQNKQLELSERQVELQEDAANAPQVQGLTVEESIEVYNTLKDFEDLVYKDSSKKVKYTDEEKYEMMDKFIMNLAISDDEKKKLAGYWLPDSYLNPPVIDTAPTQFTTPWGGTLFPTFKP